MNIQLISKLFSNVELLSSKQRQEYVQSAIDWLSNKKEESVYFTDDGISLDECQLIDIDYICDVEIITNSQIVSWFQQHSNILDPLQSMITCIIDSNDHPFFTLHADAHKIAESDTYSRIGRENAKEKVSYMITNMLIRLNFLVINANQSICI